MTTVKHRFAEIHQTHDIIRSDKIWATLTNNELSVVTVSSVCQNVISNVETGALPFSDTLLALQNLVLTCRDRLKTSVFLRAISVLLRYHGQKAALHDTIEFTLTSIQSSATTTMIHPFIMICRQRPELCDDLFFELDFLFSTYHDNQYAYSLLDTLGVFFDSVFLLSSISTSQQLLQKTLLGKFSNTSSTALRIELYYYLVNVIERMPTQRAMPFYIELVDFVMAVFSSPEIPESDLASMATLLFYQLLCRAYDGATYGYSTLLYLQRLERLYHIRDICTDQPLTQPNLYLAWPSYCYLLITSQTVNDQSILLRLMHDAINSQQLEQHVLLLAILPLFQTWTEIVDNDPTTKERKQLVLDILSHMSFDAAATIEEKLSAKDKITHTLKEFEITGTMAHMIPFLLDFIDHQKCNVTTPTSSVSHIHSLIFTTPCVFSDNAGRNASLDQLARLSSMTTTRYSFKFPVFLLVLYLMKSKATMKSDTFLHIYQQVIPFLVDTNDPIVTTKILQTVLPMMHASRDTMMGVIGFKTLVKIYEQQPRVWYEVKKAMANWILHRKSTMRSDDMLSIQMELAMLTSMRDLCIKNPRTCAQDILPMVMSLLQSCNDLNIASLALIVNIMCACIKAGLTEPRSLWNVAIQYIAAFAMGQPQHQMVILWTKICEFFAMVGDANEASESYYEFKEDVLFNYLEPLISSNINTIRSCALSALAHFPVDDMMRLLPEKAKQLTDEMIAVPDDAYTTVFKQLLSHELDHMRRNLFKEENSGNNGQNDPSLKKQKTVMGKKEADLTSRFVQTWEQSRTAPGVRTGYTIALLHASNNHMKETSASSITKTKWYRCMTTSLGDIGLTDHLLVRISCLSGWVSLFETAFQNDTATFEMKATQILQDLLTRLEKSTVPGTTCNILLALTGLVLTLHRLSPSLGVSYATQLIDILRSKYIVDTQQQADSSGRSTLVTSDEVQFAANMCLGHIAGCTISNEKLATQAFHLLLDQATDDKTQSINNDMDTVIDLAQFARGYAAAIYTAALVSWPTKTHVIDDLAKNGLSTLLQYLTSQAKQPKANESRTLGIMMGWASKMQPCDMYQVCAFALETLKVYLAQRLSPQYNKGILIGSCWVAAYAATDDDGNVDSTTLDILQKVVEKAANDTKLAQHTYHFSISSAYLNRIRFLYRDETENTKSFEALLRKEIKIINGTDVSDATTSILCLGSLLGADYLSTSFHLNHLQSGMRAYSNEARVEALDTLGYAAGVLGGSLTVGNLKNTRIAAVVCGKVDQVASVMRDTKILQNDSGDSEAAVQRMLNATEPKSYNRLSNNTSFLRAAFDSLHELMHTDSLHREHAMEILLSSLSQVPGPLPPVNWFPLLTDISNISNCLRTLAITFASRHAATSMSLTEYIISQLSEPHKDRQVQEILASKIGFGKIFELSGLPDHNPSKTFNEKRRGMDAITKKTSISEMRCIEIFEVYIKMVKNMDAEVQTLFLTTLSDHLPPVSKVVDEHLELLVKSLRDVTYFNITLPLLDGQQPSTSFSLIQKAIECSIKDSEQINQQEITTETAYAHCIAISELCRLGRTMPVSPIQLVMDTIRQLLLKKIDANEAAWYQIAKAILQTDCASTKQKLAWVTRILDTLIVIGSSSHHTVNVDEDKSPVTFLVHGLANGLRCVLSMMWWHADQISCKECDSIREPEITLLDTRYMFAHIMYLGNQYPEEQQQMTKRILKLTTLAENWGSENQLRKFFIQVIRDSPEKAISATRNQDQISQIVVNE